MEGVTEFFMAMPKVPTVTHQEKKVSVIHGKPVFYEPPELKDARAKLIAYLLPHKPEEPYSGPVELMVKWSFPTEGKHRQGSYRKTKPDTDNLQKLLKDCMTRCGFWKDDALVCREIVEKFWGDPSGIYIWIRELT
jgi:Holliday junction resolvase RusA-like endonuclease